MSLLQFVVIISAVIFLFFWVDLYKRKKMNALHFVVFLWGWWLVILFASNVNLLNQFWQIFWVARWADLMVYIALIALLYLYIELLNKHTKDKYQLTRLISREAVFRWYDAEKNTIKNISDTGDFKDEFIFNIRVYNEWKTIWTVIDDVFHAWFRKILVINDWSRDNTLSILNQKKEQYPDKTLIVVSHTINRWGGAANQTWFNFVSSYHKDLKVRWLVGFDADGQMDVRDMEKFMHEIQKSDQDNQTCQTGQILEILLWSRFINGTKNESMPLPRKIILKISKILTTVFYWAKVSDPHNWFRVISVNALPKINLTADWMHYANEINESIKKNMIIYKEVPVNIIYTDYSLWKWQKNSNSIKLWFEMIYKKLFFR